MGWLNRKLAEIKELREIENEAKAEEQKIVDAENKAYRKQKAIETGKARARKNSDALKHDAKVNKAIERGKSKAHTSDASTPNDMNQKLVDMWKI